MHVFILSFMMNINNFEPVVVKDCFKIEMSQSVIEVQKQIKNLGSLKLKCDQIDDKISYICITPDQQLVGRVIVLKDLSECKVFAQKISKDMKNLLNIK